MSTTDVQGERSARKQRQLLDAAERVYHRHGDLGLTVRRLAAEADATSQTIYTYFGSRDAVIDGMYDRITSDVARLLDVVEGRLVARGDDPEVASAALADAAAVYRSYCVGHPARFDMLSAGHGPDGWDPAPMVELRERLLTMIGKSLSGADDHDDRSRLLLATWNGVVKAQLDGLLPASAVGVGVRPTVDQAESPVGEETDSVAAPAEAADVLLRALIQDLVPGRPFSAAVSNGS